MTFYFDRPPTGVSAQQLIDAGAAEPLTFDALHPGTVILGRVGYGKSIPWSNRTTTPGYTEEVRERVAESVRALLAVVDPEPLSAAEVDAVDRAVSRAAASGSLSLPAITAQLGQPAAGDDPESAV